MLEIMYVIRSKLRIGLTMKFLALRHSNVKQSMIRYLRIPNALSTIDKRAANESSICGTKLKHDGFSYFLIAND
jgi:hypothetical protein